MNIGNTGNTGDTGNIGNDLDSRTDRHATPSSFSP